MASRSASMDSTTAFDDIELWDYSCLQPLQHSQVENQLFRPLGKGQHSMQIVHILFFQLIANLCCHVFCIIDRVAIL